LVVRWRQYPVWIALHDPISSEWAEVRTEASRRWLRRRTEDGRRRKPYEGKEEHLEGEYLDRFEPSRSAHSSLLKASPCKDTSKKKGQGDNQQVGRRPQERRKARRSCAGT
jgi:hypothetical protein